MIITEPNLTGGVPLPATAPTDRIPVGVLPRVGDAVGVVCVRNGEYFELLACVDAVDEQLSTVDAHQVDGPGEWRALERVTMWDISNLADRDGWV